LQYIEKLTEGKPEKRISKLDKKENRNDHAETIRDFIKIFGKFNEIKEDIISGDQKHKIFLSLYTYMQIVKEKLVKEELFKKHSEDEIEEILEGIENYIMKKLYKV
jgi:hypothetical protein